MKKNLLIMCVTIGALCSCSQNENDFTELGSIQNDHRLTAEQAIANANAYLDNFNTNQTRASLCQREVADVTAYTKSGVRGETTRGKADEETAFYIVNYKDDNGFILAAADDRNVPVYAFVEKGHYDGGETGNQGFDMFIKNLVERIIYKSDSLLLKSKTPSPTRTIVGPMLQTAWGVNSPYNQHTQYTVAGPMGVALAQIAAYYQYPSSLSYTNSAGTPITTALDWSSILSECSSNNGHLTQVNTNSSQVSYLIDYIDGNTNVENPYLSTVALERMYNLGYYLELDVIHSFALNNSDAIVSGYLDQGRLIYARGTLATNDPYEQIFKWGHAWVVDGYFVDNNATNFHCNWGWDGNYNGWFLSTNFVPYSGHDYNYQRCYMYVYR